MSLPHPTWRDPLGPPIAVPPDQPRSFTPRSHMSVTRTAKGTAYLYSEGLPVSSISIPNVTLVEGASLIVMAACILAVGQTNWGITSVKWGAVSLTQRVKYDNDSNVGVAIYDLHDVTAGTATITLTTTAPKPTSLMLLATQLEGLESSPFDVSGQQFNTNNFPYSFPLTQNAQDTEYGMAAVVVSLDDQTALGTWGFDYSAGQSVQAPYPDDPFTLMEGYYSYSSIPPESSAGLVQGSVPSNAWVAGVAIYKRPAPPAPTVSLGGYTSYDLALTVPRAGAVVLPEVEARIRAGDQRFMRR